MRPLRPIRAAALAFLLLFGATAAAQTVTVDTSPGARGQTIDGFGTCLSGTEAQSDWWRTLYFDDLAASIVRFDIVPHFKAPYSDFAYNSPWYHDNPPLPGPDGNNVRTYTSATDYTRSFAGRKAAIAVMGPDIDQNVAYFDYDDDGPKTAGLLAQVGNQKKPALGDFKLIASMWSPAPWLKLSSGNTISGQNGNLPMNGTPWPFIWGGNFAGGKLDVSGTPRAEFDDSSVGGSGPTSALVQFARGLVAYLRGFQNRFGVKLYAISIQNELNFETFYNSAYYPLSSDYIAALVAARTELDKYDDLKAIRIMGPEDLLGGDGYGMWQYGGGSGVTHKNLQYLANVAADAEASAALEFFNVHGYASDGVSSSGANPKAWDWWVNGWTTAPGAGLPATVKGISAYGKKSWMTETSGEDPAWLAPASGFPNNGGFSIAVKLHQALTTGRESAWVYWQTSDGSNVGPSTLTDATKKDASPKYVAAKHFFKYVRPGAVRAGATVTGGDALLASAFVDAAANLTTVLVNTASTPATVKLALPAEPAGITAVDAHTSSDGELWAPSSITVTGGGATVPVPGYGVVTLVAKGAPVSVPDAGTPSDGGTGPSRGGHSNAGGTGGSGATPSGGTTSAGNRGDGGSLGGASVIGSMTASGGATASNADAGTPAARVAGNDSSCGCRTPRGPMPRGAAQSVMIILALMLARRRRCRTT
jgi:O-glycosyl hydrolase